MTTRHAFETDPGALAAMIEALKEAGTELETPASILDQLYGAEGKRLAKTVLRLLTLHAPLTDPLPPDHYLITVERSGLTTQQKIGQYFDLDTVSRFISDERQLWQRHASRILSSVGKMSQVVAFAQPITGTTSLEAEIAAGLSKGYFPADLAEGFALSQDQHTRGIQRVRRVFCAGSFADTLESGRHVPVLHMYGSRPAFQSESTRCPLKTGDSVLLIKAYNSDQLPAEKPLIVTPPHRDWVTVSDSADVLLARASALSEHRFVRAPTLSEEHFPDWELERDEWRPGTFQVAFYKLEENVDGIRARASFQHHYEGNVPAFIAWCLEQKPEGRFFVLPSPRLLRKKYQIAGGYETIVYNNQPGEKAFFKACAFGTGPVWKAGMTCVAFKRA